MPIYSYKCKSCGKEEDIFLRMDEEIEECNSVDSFDCQDHGELERCDFFEKTVDVDTGDEGEEPEKDRGEVVEEKIEEFKQEKQEMKEEYKKREIDPNNLEKE